MTVAFLGPLSGILTHWDGKDSTPCPGPDECPKSVHQKNCTWKGYAPVRYHQPAGDWWLPAVLEITECLEELLRGRYLPGELWQIFRLAGKRKGRKVEAQYLETRPIDGVFEWFDPRPVVARRYHMRPILWDVSNPLVERVVLPAVQAPAPGQTAVRAIAPARAETLATREDIMRLKESLNGVGRVELGKGGKREA